MTHTLSIKSPSLSQEGLKLIACITMLIDHIGATIVLQLVYAAESAGDYRQLYGIYQWMRIIGRLAFPIYAFLLAEGSFHTRNPQKYALRLFLAALIAEIPYDLGLHGALSWQHQNVMITLLLSFLALQAMKKTPSPALKLLIALPFSILARYLHGDYGSNGVWLVVLFALTRDLPHRGLWQFLGIWMIFSPGHLMMLNWLDGFSLQIQELAVLAVVPISLYSGSKRSRSKALQWAFYLFYPVHTALLWIIQEVI